MHMHVRHVQTGDRLTGGDIYATVQENSLIEHRIMLPPGARGNVTYIAPAGEYSLEDKVIEVEFGGVKKVCCTTKAQGQLCDYNVCCVFAVQVSFVLEPHPLDTFIRHQPAL